MEIIVNIVCFVAAFLGMEFVAWFTHKYIMHGFLWKLHRSHHQKEKGFFEWNDFFFLFFGTIGAILIFTGVPGWNFKFFLGAGITAYGITYITLHDIFIHNRLKIFNNTDVSYLRAMRKAHRAHHSHTQKQEGESFGLLWVQKKYFS